jgi:hypothetical protein
MNRYLSKKSSLYLGMIVILLLMANALPAFSQNTTQLTEPEPLACKWKNNYCPDGNSRKVCITDGDQTACSCGDVTCSC